MEWSESLAGSKDALRGVGFPERETHSRWTGQWILNGWGIMDETCGETGTGFSVRMFNPPRKRWDVTFFAAGFQGSRHGGLHEGKMVLDRRGIDQGRRFTKRLIFCDIGPSGYKWTSEQVLNDGGLESWGYIDCERVR